MICQRLLTAYIPHNVARITLNKTTTQSLLYRSRFNIYVEAQKTPNPNFLKFIPDGQNVLGQ